MKATDSVDDDGKQKTPVVLPVNPKNARKQKKRPLIPKMTKNPPKPWSNA